LSGHDRWNTHYALSDSSHEGGGGGLDSREPVAQKKHDRGWGRAGMRNAADEKLEIIDVYFGRVNQYLKRGEKSKSKQSKAEG